VNHRVVVSDPLSSDESRPLQRSPPGPRRSVPSRSQGAEPGAETRKLRASAESPVPLVLEGGSKGRRPDMEPDLSLAHHFIRRLSSPN
jgi:hypothetical protein